jgi:hypothetical protein
MRNVLDALCNEPHSVPDHEYPGRHRHALAGVDHDAIAGGEERLHRIAIDGDDVEVVGARAKLVPDNVLGEELDVFRLLEPVMKSPGPG